MVRALSRFWALLLELPCFCKPVLALDRLLLLGAIRPLVLAVLAANVLAEFPPKVLRRVGS